VLRTLGAMCDDDNWSASCLDECSLTQLAALIEGASNLIAEQALEYAQIAFARRLDGKRANELRELLGAVDDFEGDEERVQALAEPAFTPDSPVPQSTTAGPPALPVNDDAAEAALAKVDVITLIELKGVNRAWRALGRRALCSRLCRREGHADPRQLDEITEFSLQLIIEAGRPWEAVWAGLLLHLERLTGYGFVVDVAAVRKVDLDDDGGEEVEEQEDTLLPLLRGLAKRDLCRCVTGEGEPPLALLLGAIACAGSGEIRGIPVEKLRADTLSSLDSEGRMIGPEGAMLIGIVIPLNAVLKNCYLLKNSLNVESATMLTKIGTEKGIMLSGMTRDQTYSNFSSQNLRPADAILIASDLKFMAVVTTLDLQFNSIGNEGAKAIAEALKVTAVVTTLRLNSNIIGDEGAIAIAEALKVNAVLTTLRLDANKIGAEGAKAIEEALKVNAVLTELWFGHNQIGDEGAKAIAEALKLGTAVMTTLSLAKNMIGDDGAMAIAEALKANAVLIRLVLHHNNIGDDGAKAIAEVLKVNAVVTKLNIKYNSMGVAGQQAMQDAVKDRSGFELERYVEWI
jgi:hypothetical protein